LNSQHAVERRGEFGYNDEINPIMVSVDVDFDSTAVVSGVLRSICKRDGVGLKSLVDWNAILLDESSINEVGGCTRINQEDAWLIGDCGSELKERSVDD
jgi:hypothetical protein